MAPFLKIPSRNPVRSLTVAALAALAVAMAVPAGIVILALLWRPLLRLTLRRA